MDTQQYPTTRSLAELAAAIHDHRISIRNLAGTLRHLQRCLSAPLPKRTRSGGIPSDLDMVFESAQELQVALQSVLAQSEERIGEPGAAQLSRKLTTVREDLSYLLETLGAENVFRLRDIATGLQDHIANARAENKLPLTKERVKSLVGYARELESRVCLYDVVHVEEIVQATLDHLGDVYSQLGGETATEDRNVPLEVISTIVEAINRWDHIAKQRNIALRLRAKQGHPVYVRAPKRDVIQAMNNLLDNAIKYTGRLPPNSPHERPWIIVTAKATGGIVSIAVESWGVPFTQEEMQGKLFFNYGFRGHYARQHPNAEGSGEGLADVQRIVRDLGGSVAVHSEPVAKGQRMSYRTTEVVLTLPEAAEVTIHEL
jgi:signal transduction histidine kinase